MDSLKHVMWLSNLKIVLSKKLLLPKGFSQLGPGIVVNNHVYSFVVSFQFKQNPCFRPSHRWLTYDYMYIVLSLCNGISSDCVCIILFLSFSFLARRCALLDNVVAQAIFDVRFQVKWLDFGECQSTCRGLYFA